MSGTGFYYRAAHRDGHLETGVVQAASREAAGQTLAARGLFALELRPDRAAEPRGSRLPVNDLALGLRVMATLLDSGLPLARALAAMDDLVPASWRGGLPAVRESVRQGGTLAAALQSSTLGIPPLVIGMVQAGEAGSGIAPAVRRAAELTEQAAATRRALRSALAYPMVLAGAGLLSVALMVTVVLPRFAAILADLGQTLPRGARMLLAASDAVRAGWLPAGVTIVLLLVAWRAWVASEAGRRAWDAFLLAMPIVGDIRRASAVSRFSAALAALLDSGVPIASAMQHASRAMGDAALAWRVLSARDAVVAGSGVARALEAADAMTPTAARLLRAGEEAGQVAAMLQHASRIEGERAEGKVRGAVRLLEPALIIGFGGMVAVVAGSLLQAVYSIRPGT